MNGQKLATRNIKGEFSIGPLLVYVMNSLCTWHIVVLKRTSLRKAYCR